MKISELIKVTEGQLYVDVPNDDWLQGKIEYAQSKKRNSFGVPYMGATTAYTRENVRVPVDILKRLPGMRGEQQNVRKDDLFAIMKIMKSTGKLPTLDSGKEYAPFVNVAYNGEAWVNEGNHRIMAAAALGWKDIPVQISYFDGGERVKSGAMYPGKIGLGTVEGTEQKMLETAFAQMSAQQIVAVAQDSFAQLYPGVKLYGKGTVEGVGLSTQKGGAGTASAFAGSEAVRGEFYITLNAYAEGNEMIVVIEDATAGRYKGAATAIIQALFAAGERLYKTQTRELVINDNANYDAWNTIASRVGAEIVSENFADGKNPGRKGLAKRSGVNCKQSVTKLRSIAKNSSGERQRMAHWCANMKSGRNKG